MLSSKGHNGFGGLLLQTGEQQHLDYEEVGKKSCSLGFGVKPLCGFRN